MSIIATYAGKVFQVNPKKIYTFFEFSYTSALQTEKQDVDGSKPSTYIKGTDLDSMSFSIKLDASSGINPRKEWDDWKSILGQKTAYPFILGGVPLSNAKWLLIDVTPTNFIFDNSGRILSLDLGLKFEEYVRPGSKKESSTGRKSGNRSPISVPGLIDILENQPYTMPDDSELKRENPHMIAQSKIRSGRSLIY